MMPADDSCVTLYHGTSCEAGLAIQNRGFRVDLSGTNAGTMLGNGVYLTASLEKELHYAKPNAFRCGDRPAGGCILMVQAQLGRCKELTSNDPMMRSWHESNFDSAHSGDGVNGAREEWCVRDASCVTVAQVILGQSTLARERGYSVQRGCLERSRSFSSRVRAGLLVSLLA